MSKCNQLQKDGICQKLHMIRNVVNNNNNETNFIMFCDVSSPFSKSHCDVNHTNQDVFQMKRYNAENCQKNQTLWT